ncbi:MAG TPA: CPBP family glutamic-type intramembrane protease [Gemmatimonadaceae bacterium]|nr:CPBP family glutamic-type intramembrane protease [Gemmatimonadaceae bacterium]
MSVVADRQSPGATLHPAIFGNTAIAAGLAAGQVARLDGCSRIVEFAAGDVVLAIGSVSPGLHLLLEGTVEVRARSGSADSLVRVASLLPGAVFGELSALAGTAAISEVAAVSAARVAIADVAQLEGSPDDLAIRNVLGRNVIRLNQERLSASNASYVAELEERLALLAQRNSYSRFLILVIVLFGICLLVNRWVSENGTVDLYSPAFAWAYLATLVVPTTWMVWREKYPLRVFGFTKDHLGRDLARASAITIALVGLLVGTLALTGYPIAEKLHPEYLLRYGPLYAAHSALQEFMVRGVLMGMLLQIFGDATRRERHGANFAASLMFALVHIHFGVTAVLVTFAFSLLLGAYYLTSRSLAGVALIHIVVGLSAFMLGVI